MARKTAILAIAALLLVQGALAYETVEDPTPSKTDYKKGDEVFPYTTTTTPERPVDVEEFKPYQLGGSSDAYAQAGPEGGFPAFPAMTCTGHSYCFKRSVAPLPISPMCPKGFSFDDEEHKCYKYVGYTCPKDTYPCNDPTACLECPKKMVLGGNDVCEKPCKEGYVSVKCSGGQYCVKECDTGYYSYGENCLSFTKYKYPKKCDGKCPKGYEYMHSNSAYSPDDDEAAYADPEYGSAYEAYDADVKSKYASEYSQLYAGSDSYEAEASCKCVKSKKKDAYKMETALPTKVASSVDMVWSVALCPDGKEVDKVSGLCGVGCPAGCVTNSDGRCEYACPHGYKECKKGGQNFCTTKYDLFGCDSCEVMSKLYNHLEDNVLCPTVNSVIKPSPKPVVLPSPAKPVASPKPAPKGSPKPAPKGSPKPAPKGSPKPAPKGSPKPAPKGSPKPAAKSG